MVMSYGSKPWYPMYPKSLDGYFPRHMGNSRVLTVLTHPHMSSTIVPSNSPGPLWPPVVPAGQPGLPSAPPDGRDEDLHAAGTNPGSDKLPCGHFRVCRSGTTACKKSMFNW